MKSNAVLPRIGFPTGGRRQWPALSLVQIDRLLHDFAELRKDLLLVLPVAPTVEQFGAAHVALIRIRPFNDFQVSCAFFHFLDSSRTRSN
jgi:hypothetical protein